MSTENPLATMQETAIATANDDMFKAVASTGSYLPRLQLMTSASEKCKSGEFPMNHYARVQDGDFRDLGPEVDVLVVAWRPLAIEETPDGGILSFYDPTSDDFARVQVEADKPGMNGHMYGPQFLLWVPSQAEFMSFFMASKTARRASVGVKAQMVKSDGTGGTGMATLGSQKIEGKEFTWYGPTCRACSTPFEMPTEEECRTQMQSFANPPKPEMERVDESEVSEDRE